MKFCVNCGKKIKDGTKFCPYCGADQTASSNNNQNQNNQANNQNNAAQNSTNNVNPGAGYQPVYGGGAYAAEEMQLNQEQQQLSPQEQMVLETEVNNSAQQPVIAWILWFFLGDFGAHRFYLHQNNAVTIIGWVTLFLVIGGIILFAMFIWWIVDAFSIQKWIKQNRIHIKSMILQNMLRQKSMNNN